MLFVFSTAPCLREQSHPLRGHLKVKEFPFPQVMASQEGISHHNSGSRKEKILLFTHFWDLVWVWLAEARGSGKTTLPTLLITLHRPSALCAYKSKLIP